MISTPVYFSFFFFNDTATTEIYTLSLHDALPIYVCLAVISACALLGSLSAATGQAAGDLWQVTSQMSPAAWPDRKSTRLNSSHLGISYAVFCLKKKNKYDLSRKY